MKNMMLWSTVAAAAMVTLAGSAASAQEVSTTAGFQLGSDGGVTALTISTAVSDTFAFSSGVINTGGVYTEAFASTNDWSFLALQAPLAVEFGRNVNPDDGSTVLILSPNAAILIPE